MAKVMLFGSSTVFGVPQNIMTWLQEYTNQGVEFIVGDNKGADSAFHKALTSIGATNVTIYCMESAKNNIYEHKTKVFNTYYDADAKEVTIVTSDNSIEPFVIEGVEKEMDIQHTREWYEFKDRQMIKDCDMAIGLWDGDSKGPMHIAQLLNINNKPCYFFNINQ